MCSAHEQRSRAGRDMDAPFRETLRGANVPETCTLGDCTEPHYGKGMCKLHYERVYNGRPLDGPRRRNPRVPGVTRKRTKDGYILLWLPEHPAAFGPGWVFEHRAVMESHLGRYLLPGETVHHKYGGPGRQPHRAPGVVGVRAAGRAAGRRPGRGSAARAGAVRDWRRARALPGGVPGDPSTGHGAGNSLRCRSTESAENAHATWSDWPKRQLTRVVGGSPQWSGGLGRSTGACPAGGRASAPGRPGRRYPYAAPRPGASARGLRNRRDRRARHGDARQTGTGG